MKPTRLVSVTAILAVAAVGAHGCDGGVSRPPASWPCGRWMDWDPDEPLRLSLSSAPDTDAFLRGLRLTDEAGAEVPLVVARLESWPELAVCARDGLRGDTDYTWEIGPWRADASNELADEQNALPTVRFHTQEGDGSPAATPAACKAHITDDFDRVDDLCDGVRDTGFDTG